MPKRRVAPVATPVESPLERLFRQRREMDARREQDAQDARARVAATPAEPKTRRRRPRSSVVEA
jgi:hypothetical protein